MTVIWLLAGGGVGTCAGVLGKPFDVKIIDGCGSESSFRTEAPAALVSVYEQPVGFNSESFPIWEGKVVSSYRGFTAHPPARARR